MKPSLIVLAAGLGSRYGADKQLAGVGPHGEPILLFTALDAAAAGFGELVLVVRPELEPLTEELFGRRLRAVLPVRYAHQCPAAGRTRPWGTAHALAVALDGLAAPCGVVNADDWYGPPSLATLAAWLAGEGADACLVAFHLGRTLSPHGAVNRGIAVAEAGRLVAIDEVEGLRAEAGGARGPDGRLHPASTLVSMNLWGLRPGMYRPFCAAVAAGLAAHREDRQWECQLPTLIRNGMDDGRWRVNCTASVADWCGLTFAADRPEVQARLARAVAEGLYPGLEALS